MKTICVLGGGAAGVIAAYAASLSENVSVILLERNQKPCRKLLITGKGRCNITNMGDLDDYMGNIPRNGSFLFSAFSSFGNYDLLALLNENGLNTKLERGARVFPESDKAQDVAELFAKLLKERNVSVCCGKRVTGISRSKGVFTLNYGNAGVDADSVILATGGLSYPQTGSTGDGYKLAKELGHSVTKLYPSLTALNVKEKSVSKLAGLSLKNVAIALIDNNEKTVYKDFGELLFTHTGVSGPVVLSASARAAKRLGKEVFKLYIDFKPALDEKKLDLRLLRDFNKYKNRDLQNALDELLPKSAIPVIIGASGVPLRKKVNEITKEERKKLSYSIKSFPLTITGSDGFENAVITCGGINVDEINPRTMGSKITEGLFFAGEMIDVDAYTGGYNLQIAFSTGYLAGISAAKYCLFKQEV